MSKPYGYRRLMIGQGAAQEPKTLEGAGTTGQALRIATTGDEPAWGTLDATTVLGATIVPVANGGTGQTVGAVAIMQFTGTAVAAGATVFLGQDDDATEQNVQFRAAFAGSALRMTSAATAPGGTDTYTYTLRVANADTAITHVVTGVAVQGTSTGAAAIAQSDRLSVKLATSATAAVNNHTVTLLIRVDG